MVRFDKSFFPISDLQIGSASPRPPVKFPLPDRLLAAQAQAQIEPALVKKSRSSLFFVGYDKSEADVVQRGRCWKFKSTCAAAAFGRVKPASAARAGELTWG